jgi:hypothetical protein
VNHLIDKSLTRSTVRSQYDFQAFRQPEQFGLLLSIHWRDDPMVVRYHAIDNDGNVMDFVDLETMIVSEHVMERALQLMKQMEGEELHSSFNRLAHWLSDTLSTEFPRHFNSIVRIEQCLNKWNSMLHDYEESTRTIADIGKLKKIPTFLEQSITNVNAYFVNSNEFATPQSTAMAIADAINPHNVTRAQIGLGSALMGTIDPKDIVAHLLGGEN